MVDISSELRIFQQNLVSLTYYLLRFRYSGVHQLGPSFHVRPLLESGASLAALSGNISVRPYGHRVA